MADKVQRARELINEGNLEKARTLLEEAREEDPDNKTLLNLLGMTYFKLQIYDKAEKIYSRLIKSNPDVHVLQSNLGLIYYKTGRFEQARKHLTKAREIKPDHKKTRFYLGLVDYKQGNLEKALDRFQNTGSEKMINKIKKELREKQKEQQEEKLFIREEEEESDEVNNLLSSIGPGEKKDESGKKTMDPEKTQKIKMDERDSILKKEDTGEAKEEPRISDIMVEIFGKDKKEQLPEGFDFINRAAIEISFLNDIFVNLDTPFLSFGEEDVRRADFSKQFVKCRGGGSVILSAGEELIYCIYIKCREFNIRLSRLIFLSEGFSPYLVNMREEPYLRISGEGYLVIDGSGNVLQNDVSDGERAVCPSDLLIGYSASSVEALSEEDFPESSKSGDLLEITGPGALITDLN